MELVTPNIINLDSLFDWTAEVRQVWDALDWDGMRQATTPHIPSETWASRRSEIGLVGLVSSLVIDDAYHMPQCKESRDGPEQRKDPLLRGWRERQLARTRREEADRTNSPSRNCRFHGEEPFFQSPCTGRMGVVECYGIYVDDASAILSLRGLLERVPASVQKAPAIFLCPERIFDIYPTVMGIGENLSDPLPLAENPPLANLEMTLVHELGHHFFPVHRSGSGRFLSEALANLLCYRSLGPEGQAWLLYKTWHLQPPEYSAYRPLNVLCEMDADCLTAVGTCFYGRPDGWATLPSKEVHTLERSLGASLHMAVSFDAAACKGLWWDELRCLVTPEENRWWLDGAFSDHRFHMRRMDTGQVPADFLLDLYRQSNLANWAKEACFPNEIWGRWGCGNEINWPHDAITITEADVDRWLAYYASGQDTRLASVICEKLVPLLHGNVGPVNRPGLRAALDRALTVATDDQAYWFDRVPAIRLIEACSDIRAIPALESIVETKGHGDVHDAAKNAVASLLADLEHSGGKDRQPSS